MGAQDPDPGLPHPGKCPLEVPAGYRTPPPYHFAEFSLDQSRYQAVHPNVHLGQLYGQVLGEAQQGCFTNIVRAQGLEKRENGLVSSFLVPS